MKTILASLSVLVLADTALAAPILAEPRAYVAKSSYDVGRALWSYRDAAYAAQSGSVVRYQRTATEVVKSDSVYTGSMTETPMYVAKDSLHGFVVGNSGVCMVDWSVHPAKLGKCSNTSAFGHGGFTGGLALGRYLTVCSPSGKVNTFDTNGDSLVRVDSMSLGNPGSLRCEIEGEVLHTVSQATHGYEHQRWLVNHFGSLDTRVDTLATVSFVLGAGRGAGLLGLDSTGVFERLQWGSLVHGKAITSMSRLKGRSKSASQSDSNIVVSNDSTIYLVRWTNSGDPTLAAKLSFETELYGMPAVAVDGSYVWVRTPSGLLSLVIKEATSGIEAGGRTGRSADPRISLHGRSLEITPTISGTVRILSSTGSVMTTLGLRVGSTISWNSTRGGLFLLQMEDRTLPVILP